jgi:hypothetical protein
MDGEGKHIDPYEALLACSEGLALTEPRSLNIFDRNPYASPLLCVPVRLSSSPAKILGLTDIQT